MIAIVGLLALLGCVAAAPEQRIVNGQDAEYGDHPYICSLQSRSGGQWYHICGAVLWNNEYVVTAAHCLGNTAGSYRTVCGEHRLNDNDGFEVTRPCLTYVMHPQYNGNAAGFPNDIAVMEFASVNFNDYLRPNRFPEQGESFEAETCQLSGWGRLSGGGSLPNTLQRVNIQKITNSQCQSEWSGISGASINSGHICFLDEQGNPNEPASACSVSIEYFH